MKNKPYSSFVSPKVTNIPVSQSIPGKQMVTNSDGAFVFATGHWKQLDRFLILGACAPTYYASREKLVLDNAAAIDACIAENGQKVVKRVVEVSLAGRAPKNDPALFTLALCTSKGNAETKKAAYAAIPQVARTGTHILHFTNYVDDLRGWGRGMKRAVANWFNGKSPASLAMQVVKYRQRDGWSMRDVLRTVHAKAKSDTHNAIFHYITKGWEEVGDQPHPDAALRVIWAVERAKNATSAKEVAKLVSEYGLPWEAIDTKWLNDHDVWDALLLSIKPEALMRNLGRLTSNGFLAPLSSQVKTVVGKLTDQQSLIDNRLHPLKLLVALKTYEQGHGEKGKLAWTPAPAITQALEDAYYLAFDAVEPSNKRTLLALDLSGSMTWSNVAGMPITPRVASAALAMVNARVEPEHYFVGFSSGISPLNITPKQNLQSVINYIEQQYASGTDCSLPFVWAKEHKIPVDTFVVITDNETNGGIHPSLAMQKYKQAMGIDSKLVVVGMTSTGFTIADPNDSSMLDVVGFDTATPQIISDFSSGNI